MIQLPSDITPKDIQQWLGQGWFLYKDESGGINAASLLTPEASGRVLIMLENSSEKSVAPSSLYAYWPRCGAINFTNKKTACFINRIQKKQYTRTFTTSCVNQVRVNSLPATRAPNLNNPGDVLNIFFPDYFPFREAMGKLNKDWLSTAISPSLILVKPDERGVTKVYFHGILAGRINSLKQYIPAVSSVTQKIVRQFDGEVEVV